MKKGSFAMQCLFGPNLVALLRPLAPRCHAINRALLFSNRRALWVWVGLGSEFGPRSASSAHETGSFLKPRDSLGLFFTLRAISAPS